MVIQSAVHTFRTLSLQEQAVMDWAHRLMASPKLDSTEIHRFLLALKLTQENNDLEQFRTLENKFLEFLEEFPLEDIDLPYAAITFENPQEAPVSEFAPPPMAEFLLRCILPKKDRDEIIGDLLGEYHELINRFGKRKADLFMWSQVLGSAWPFLKQFAWATTIARVGDWARHFSR